MNAAEVEAFLAQSLADRKLSGSEKQVLAGWLAENAQSDQQKGVIRHVAFDLACRDVADPDAARVIAWLEEVMKSIVPIQLSYTGGTPALPGNDSAFFSPGEECLQRITQLFHSVRDRADLCVFTITDDRISRAILDAHRRGVKLRIISDEEKSHDLGSDMQQFAESGIAVKLIRVVAAADPGTYGHMHHKFAIFDGTRLLNGSYNWTRGAANVNYENLIDSADANLLRSFSAEFDRLWNHN